MWAKIMAHAFGWVALLVGGFCWWYDAYPPGYVTGRGIIENLHVHAFTGIGAAVGVGLAFWAIRRRSGIGVAWIALLTNASLVTLEIIRITECLLPGLSVG